MEFYLHIQMYMYTHVRKGFDKEYNYILDKVDKSTSIYFLNVHFSYHVGSKTLSSNVVYVYADKKKKKCALTL